MKFWFVVHVLYVILFFKGTLSKSIQKDTVNNRIAALETIVEKLEARINNTENTVGDTNDHRRAVFYARLTSSKTLNVYSTIQFDKVVINAGGHYNPTDGVFVAPVTGVYLFAWSTVTYNGNAVYSELRVDGASKASLESSAGSGQYIPGSMSLVCHVEQGSHVWIQTSSGTSGNYIHDLYDSPSFMGLLLYME